MLRRFFNYCGAVVGNDMRTKKQNRTRSQLTNAEYHLTAEQMNKIIGAALSPRDRLMLQIMAETGLRRCEIAGMRIEDCRIRERLLLIRRGKGNKSRLVPLMPPLANSLKQYIADKATGPLFESAPGRPISTRQINRVVAAAGERAGIRNPNPKYARITPHLFRHSFARLWKDRGGSIEALSKLLGHSSTALTWDVYGTMSLMDIQLDYEKLMRPAKRTPRGNRNISTIPKGG